MEFSSLITEGALPPGSFTDDILHVCVWGGHALQWSSITLYSLVLNYLWYLLHVACETTMGLRRAG